MDKKYYVLFQDYHDDCDSCYHLPPLLFSSYEDSVHAYSRRVLVLNDHWRVRLCRIVSLECLMVSSIDDARG